MNILFTNKCCWSEPNTYIHAIKLISMNTKTKVKNKNLKHCPEYSKNYYRLHDFYVYKIRPRDTLYDLPISDGTINEKQKQKFIKICQNNNYEYMITKNSIIVNVE